MAGVPVIGITAGDPAGIGPEVLQNALAEVLRDPRIAAEWRVVGPAEPVSPGKPGAEGARRAWDALEEAASLASRGEIDAVVTGPVCKHNLHAAGFPFPGQTEFFAARSGAGEPTMILAGGRLTVALATVHEPLRAVAGLLDQGKVVRAGKHLAEFLRFRLGREPSVAVAGLNPHAGENGDIGDEEERVIAPAVRTLEAAGAGKFCGPHPPDTVFVRAAAGNYDGVVCMYHDQGLIPVKLLAFDTAVNVTWGLPFFRSSPDHGTAFDIAGKGVASHSSMAAAMRLAAAFAKKKPGGGH